jgi:hypothetical protein
MDPTRRAQLAAQLRECGEAELMELFESELGELEVEVVRSALHNPHVSSRVIELVLAERRLLSSHQVQKELAQHPKTPEPRALNLVPGLYWSDLVELGGNARIRPQVRRAADRRLIERLPKLGIGERVAIARKAGPGVITRLLQDGNLRVIGALLENPRMTEALLTPLIHSEMARAEVLRCIAGDRKWGSRYSIRNGIARNPKSPVSTALELLVYLRKSDLREVRVNHRIASAVRRKAGVLLGIEPNREGNTI